MVNLIKHKVLALLTVLIVAFGLAVVLAPSAVSATSMFGAVAPEPRSPTNSTPTSCSPNSDEFVTDCQNAPQHQCGSSGIDKFGNKVDGAVYVSIDFGCYGEVCIDNPSDAYCTTYHNGITDVTFAIIRFLSAGVGLVVIGSIIVGGIQYSASRGDPKATATAIERIRASVIALIIYIFGFAILNYVIPGVFLK